MLGARHCFPTRLSLDGFVLESGLFVAALIGAAGFLACLGAMCHSRYRQLALIGLKFGSVGGLIAFVAMALIYLAVGTAPDTPRSLFFLWTALAFFAGFAAGALVM